MISSNNTWHMLRVIVQRHVLGPHRSKFGNKIVEPKFNIHLSPQQDRSKLCRLEIWIEWFDTFQNKLL